MIIQDAKSDMQVQHYVSKDPRKGYFGPISKILINILEPPRKKNLSYIVNTIYSQDENRMTTFSEYIKPEYTKLIERDLKEVEKDGYKIYDDHKDTFVGFTANEGKSWFFLVKASEIMAREGHVTLMGIPERFPFKEENYWYNQGPKLNELLPWGKDKDAIIFPTHPLSKVNVVQTAILKVSTHPSGPYLGIQEENIFHFRDFWDAIEKYSLSMSPEQISQVEELAGRLNIPAIVNTDSPTDKSLTSYTQFSSLDFSSPERLRASMRGCLRNNDYETHIQRLGTIESLWDKASHIGINLLQNRKYF